MGALLVLGLACLTLMVTGCGGGDETKVRPDELPVACVAKSGSGKCTAGRGKYYYDYQNNRCLPTGVGRCGSTMLFDSYDACSRYCGGRP